MIVLGIETSCDETAVSICKDGNILSNVISSQEIHSEFGGVVPEIASREHEKMLNNITVKAIKDASIKIDDIEGIAVTNGPGLAGSLLTGVSFAKGLALGLKIKIIPINHLEAHIIANLLDNSDELDNYILLGETRDDAAGEAFDKGARVMGLGYPGGPEIEKCAINGDAKLIKFPRALNKSKKIEFSFSGVKTSLLYFMDSYNQSHECSLADVAASYQQAIIDCLINKIELATDQTGINTITIAGGVAKNTVLRSQLKKNLSKNKIIFPDMDYCTDNAAMVSYLGEIKFNLGSRSNLDFGIFPNFQLQSN